jgi:hypothetical protein
VRGERGDAPSVQASDLALVRGLADTRATLDAWNERPGPVVGRWLAGALAIAVLPPGARIIASRHDDWHELLAATLVTVLLAVSVLVAAAFVQVYVSPGLLRALAG